ncbi:mucin-17-like, partial [Diaphorina citri]|uniref:Mucin-17-like n=1 Tax=Diaphorina citri TaxID=121845 RepID=A0A1S3DR72_DIACI
TTQTPIEEITETDTLLDISKTTPESTTTLAYEKTTTPSKVVQSDSYTTIKETITIASQPKLTILETTQSSVEENKTPSITTTESFLEIFSTDEPSAKITIPSANLAEESLGTTETPTSVSLPLEITKSNEQLDIETTKASETERPSTILIEALPETSTKSSDDIPTSTFALSDKTLGDTGDKVSKEFDEFLSGSTTPMIVERQSTIPGDVIDIDSTTATGKVRGDFMETTPFVTSGPSLYLESVTETLSQEETLTTKYVDKETSTTPSTSEDVLSTIGDKESTASTEILGTTTERLLPTTATTQYKDIISISQFTTQIYEQMCENVSCSDIAFPKTTTFQPFSWETTFPSSTYGTTLPEIGTFSTISPISTTMDINGQTLNIASEDTTVAYITTKSFND